MDGVIGNDDPLDYVEFQLFPNQDRYEACACSGDETETIAYGLLGQLVLHVPNLKDLFSRGSKASFQVQRPEDLDTSHWFTKATMTRFLHVVGSMDTLNTTTSIQNEIAQLEEAKKSHLSLYTMDESEAAPSDASKNELLRAMESRLTTLKTEFATAFNRAAGTNCFPKHISNMEKLAQHLGDIYLRNTLRKFLELWPMDQKVDLPINSSNDSVEKSDEKIQTNKLSGLDTLVKYGVSPAKAAQIEGQSCIQSEKSSEPSEDEQPSAERSRSLARSASPRRSASPMRRVKIGRSGSRRATALTIKSLSSFPGRDRTQTCRDACSSDEEGSEKPSRKSDNALRISVKDAISLFENKQKDHTSDADKRRSTLDASFGAKKSVLRRWSAGVQDPESVSESSSQLNSENVEVEVVEAKADVEIVHRDNKTTKDTKVDETLHSITERMSKPMDCEPDILVIQHEEDTEKLTASVEWNRQKEAELNEMLKKMTQSKLGRNRKIVPDKNGVEDVTHERRAGFYDQYKGKRGEKLRVKAAEKRTEKDAQFRSMQQVLEQRKVVASATATAVTQSKSSLSKPEKLRQSSTPSANTKKESPKPTLANKAPKTSPPVRKSWPSVPSPRASTGVSPARTPCGPSSAGTTPTRRKPNTGPTGPQSSPKVERVLQQHKPKPVKATQADTKKSTKGVVGKQQQPLLKKTKIVKTKTQAVPEKESLKDVSKPNFNNKMTKKSSVVPPESKPFLRKGSGVGLGTGPVIKTKASPPSKECIKKPENLIAVKEKEVVGVDTVDLVTRHVPVDVLSEDSPADLDSEAQDIQLKDTLSDLDSKLDSKARLTTQQGRQVITNCHDSLVEKSQAQSELKTEAEEDSTISLTAWVEVDEHEESCIPLDDSKCEISSFVHEGPAVTASPRVRHSFSQMLLRESAELDIVGWGNAEIPASIVYQKDAPKGLKKLLKFSLKSKGDQNLSGWSSPSVLSEGEDDAEESKVFGNKKADTLLRKASLHASHNGHRKTLFGEGHGRDFAGPQKSYAQSNLNNFRAQSSSNRLQDHISGVVSSTKATRSFFSLSAFKGNKSNETKLR